MEDLEATRIYRSLFNRDAPPLILSRFKRVSERLNDKVSPQDLEQYYQAIRRVGDLEALEVAGRFTKKLPLLSWKFQAMVYLAETLPENQDYFVNRQTGFLKGGWLIFLGFMRTAYKLVKGFWLLGRLKSAAD